MNHLVEFRIREEIECKYIEWVEDLGLSPGEIFFTLLVKAREENEHLKKRLAKYEN